MGAVFTKTRKPRSAPQRPVQDCSQFQAGVVCVNNFSSNHSGRCNPLDASRKQAYCANHPLRRVTLQHSTQCPLRPQRLPVILQSRLVSTACGLLSEVSGPSSGLRVPRTASPGPCRPKSSLVQTTLPIPLIQSNPIQTLGGVVYLLTPRSSHRQSRPRPTPDQCAPFAIFLLWQPIGPSRA